MSSGKQGRPAYGSNIPQARKELLAIAARARDFGAAGLAVEVEGIVYGLMVRTFHGRQAPYRNPPLTLWQKREIRRLLDERPKLPQQTIAEMVGTGAGRVSEILNGIYVDRKEEP